METELRTSQITFLLWVPPFLSYELWKLKYELWKLKYELWKLLSQTPPKSLVFRDLGIVELFGYYIYSKNIFC